MLEIRFLGPFEVLLDGEPVQVSGRRRIELLARLAVGAGQVVSTERLLADVWTDGAAATAAKQLHIVVSKLREALGELIVTQRPGYVLDLTAERVDAHCFSSLVRRARSARNEGDIAQAAALLRQALKMWRGAALEGLAAPWARIEAAQLEEARAVAVEEYVDDLMALEEHAEAAAELTAHIAAHPLRERPRAQLMLALTLMGRTAEALEVYTEVRQALVSQLGVEPGAELKRLQRAVLNEEVRPQSPPPSQPAPRLPAQLPADTSAFTARREELEWLRGLLVPQAGPNVAAINGQGGIGKSALAIRAAHSVAGRFTDGLLYLNLHGSTPGLEPVQPAEALGRLLRSMGKDDAASPDEAAALFRSVTADRRLLLVLDNARDVHQVRPLLPAGSGCAVLVTSRKPLTTLDGARHLHLTGLTDEEATGLLARVAGPERTVSEPEELARVARLCGGLPLAVRISAARLAARPDWRVADLAERLADARRRLDALDYADLAVRASIAVSHHHLNAEPSGADAATLLPLLGLVDLPELPLSAVAALAGWSEGRTEAALDRLADARLASSSRRSYQIHDLTRLYAREQAAELPQEVTGVAFRRVVHHYMATLTRASILIDSTTAAVLADYPAERDGLPLPDAREAALWTQAERENVRALARQVNLAGDPHSVAALALTINRPFTALAWRDDLIEIIEQALEVVGFDDDPLGRARLHNVLGVTYRERKRPEEALEQHLAARDCLKRAGLPESAVPVRAGLVGCYRLLDRLDEALTTLEEALEEARAEGLAEPEARYLAIRGMIYLELGRHADAIIALEESVERWADVDSPYGAAIAVMNLADAHWHLEQYDRSSEIYRQGYDLAQRGGLRQGEIAALWGLGRSLLKLGDREPGMEYVRQSVLLMRELDLIGAEEAERRLATLDEYQDVPDAFMTH
ncbi:AfsR/SARP family transcriptional regulator [Nonomuraea sp. NPDC050663]|uniref:AfsR/SARP family transcriptional regulator n=1 Tax=Nonomuraea sp. NPDC050663 TaxID=3364370 RepID=UPI0037A66054